MLSSLAGEHVADADEVPSPGRLAINRGDDVNFLKSGRGRATEWSTTAQRGGNTARC